MRRVNEPLRSSFRQQGPALEGRSRPALGGEGPPAAGDTASGQQLHTHFNVS